MAPSSQLLFQLIKHSIVGELSSQHRGLRCVDGAVLPKYITVARADREVGLVNAHAHLTPFTILRWARRIVAKTVLTPQFFSDVSESVGKVTGVIGLVLTCSSLLCQFTQVSVRALVVPAISTYRAATAATP